MLYWNDCKVKHWTAYLYVLADPRPVEPTIKRARYVGTTEQPQSRLNLHIKNALTKEKDSNLAKQQWIKELHALGLEPDMYIIQHYEGWHLSVIEAFWIDFYQAEGCELFNIALTSQRYKNLIRSEKRDTQC